MSVLGVIAEDQSDVDVVAVLARKITRAKFSIRSARGRGCGRIVKHALPWAHALHGQGCTHLVLVCDLDQNVLTDLSARLTKALAGCPIAQRVVVIPVRAIEAWLLADHAAINTAFKLRRPLKKHPNPEHLRDPKSRLGELVRQRAQRRIEYVNTVHNARIAEHADVQQLLRCPSFGAFHEFVRTQLG